MIVSDVVKRVRRQFGDDFKGRIGDNDLFRWINDAQREIAIENKLLQKNTTQALSAGVAKYAVPADILQLHSITRNGFLLQGYSLKEFQAQNEDSDSQVTGEVTSFTVWAGNIWIWPYPAVGTSAPGNIVIYYTRIPADVDALADAIDLPLIYHNRVVEYCMAMAMELDEDREGYALKMQEFKVGVAATKNESEDLKIDQYPGITVVPEDYDFQNLAVYW